MRRRPIQARPRRRFFTGPASTSAFPNAFAIRIEFPHTLRFSARMKAMRANIVGTVLSTTRSIASTAACHSASFCSALRKLLDIFGGVLERDELATAGSGIGSSNGRFQPLPLMP
jgi:hypothetical protein